MADEYEEADQISRESERVWMAEMEEKAIKVTNPETGESERDPLEIPPAWVPHICDLGCPDSHFSQEED